MPASPFRKSRSPSFLERPPGRGIHVLFPAPGAEAESLFGDVSDEQVDQALGVESLAPPLPAPAAQMSEEAARRVGQAIGELRRLSERLGADLAANALEIGCLLARRILEVELKTDPALRTALVRAAVARLGAAQKIKIRLSPTDREAVEAAAGDGGLSGVGLAQIEIVADTNLTPGDCLVESDAAMVDGRLGTRLEELRRVCMAAMIDSRDGGATSS